MARHSHLAVALILAGLLSACGGGGDGGAAPLPPPPVGTCTASSFQASADATAVVGKAAGATVASSCGPITEVLWRQTAGAAVELISARTQAISFEPQSPGTYAFSIDFRDAGGAARSLTVTVAAVPPTAPVNVLVRADQAVREGGKASVRAWPAAAAGESITWTQVAGPMVSLDVGDQNRVLFTAPAVTEDTLIVLRATKRLADGGTDSDEVRVLVENYEQAPADPSNNGSYVFSDTHVSRVYPYRAGGPFAGVLVRCTYDASLQYTGGAANLCPLSTLPFLHQTTGGAVPTVSQIMDRVLVSHDWMGQVFEEFLTTQANDDIRRLFNGVTAIVIGAHVRPSFYYALTGAIYLDADNFWLTADERDVIDEAPDFRSSFDRDLQYSGVWRYANSMNQNIFLPFSATSRISRDLSYLLQESGWLMYHELAHASDFVPVSVRGSLNTSTSVWANIAPRYLGAQLPSDQLTTMFPLTSQQMKALAQVKFVTGPVADTTLVNGIPYSTLRVWSPTEVAGFFSVDRATDEYNYTTTREDIAMTFEEVMMVRNHAWRRDVAMTDKITATTTSDTLTVRWGQRGRVGEAGIKPRAQFTVDQLAPWVLQADPGAVANLPAPIAMRPGQSWAANLVLPAPPAMATAQALREPRLSTELDQILLRRAVSRQLIGIAGPAMQHGAPNERALQRLQR